MAADVEATFSINTEVVGEAEVRGLDSAAKDYDKTIVKLQKRNDELKRSQKELIGSSASVRTERSKLKTEITGNTDQIGKLVLAQKKMKEAKAPKSFSEVFGGGKAGIKSSLQGLSDLKTGAGLKIKAIADQAKSKGIKSFLPSFKEAKDGAVAGTKGLLKALDTKAFDGLQKAWNAKGPALGAAVGMLGKGAAAGASAGASGLQSLAGLAGGATVALLAAGAAAGALMIKMLDSGRSLMIHRKMLMGSTEQAKALNTWESHLADSTGLAKAQIAQFSEVIGKSRIGGEAATNALEALSLAQASMGDGLSGKLQEVITRYQKMGIMTLGRFELDGTGLDSMDVAKALSKRLKLSIPDAQRMLNNGKLKLAEGTAAIRDAVKEKFGKDIADQARGLPQLWQRAGDKFADMFSDTGKENPVEPLLVAGEKMISVFDKNTEAGAALRDGISRTAKVAAFFLVPAIEQTRTTLEGVGYLAALAENKFARWRYQFKMGHGPLAMMHSLIERVVKSWDMLKSKVGGFMQGGPASPDALPSASALAPGGMQAPRSNQTSVDTAVKTLVGVMGKGPPPDKKPAMIARDVAVHVNITAGDVKPADFDSPAFHTMVAKSMRTALRNGG